MKLFVSCGPVNGLLSGMLKDTIGVASLLTPVQATKLATSS
jgi:hypothetical protein